MTASSSPSPSAPPARPPTVGYLTSSYPAVSHTFILREVQALRAAGLPVATFSVRRSDQRQLLADADHEEHRSTFAILPTTPTRLARAHLAALRHDLLGYVATLVLALRLAPPGARGALWQLFYFAEAMILWERCRAGDVRHLHAQFADVATDVALLVSHFASRHGPRLTWSLALHGPVEFYDVSLNRLAEKVRRADLVVCISDFARSQVMALVDGREWTKLHVVHCGVDPDEFRPREDPAGADDDRGALRVLAVGRLVQLKGHAVLLEGLGELRRRGVRVRAVVVGDGPKRTELEALSRQLGLDDDVRLVGAVGQDEIRRCYAEADVFCLASFGEGVPVVLMEAMAMGLPVVSTGVMGVRELVDDGHNGRIVRPGRADLLADALAELAAAPELRRRLGEAGREKVRQEFDVRTAAGQLKRLFERVTQDA